MAIDGARLILKQGLRKFKRLLVRSGLWNAKKLLPSSWRKRLRKLLQPQPTFPRLVYDVGMNNGDDTAYYLFRGYQVVAIEASPVLAEKARARFAKEIDSGQLTLLNVGVAEKAGAQDFWINDSNADWSSFLIEQGCRMGTPCHAVKVKCVPFIKILRKYGVPHNLKIDIEGHDWLCLQALEKIPLEKRPKYVSVEAQSLEWLVLMKKLGYTHFRIVSQSVVWKINRNGWQFQGGSSGPLDDELGEWCSLEDTAYEWCHFIFDRRDRYAHLDPVTTWCDFHAVRMS